jgi:ribosomal protein S27AE
MTCPYCTNEMPLAPGKELVAICGDCGYRVDVEIVYKEGKSWNC